MENVLRVIGLALFKENSRIGKIQVRFVTLAITIVFLLIAVYLGVNYRYFSYQMLAVVGASLLAYLFIIYSIQDSLLRGRNKQRRTLYQRWQYTYALPSHPDARIDSSPYIAVLWRWRKAQIVQVRSQGNLQDNYAGKIRDISNSLKRDFNTDHPWIVDLEQYQNNVIYAYTAPADSFAYQLFMTKLTILEIAQNVLDARTIPTLDFEGLFDMEGVVYFDMVMLSNFQAQYFSEQATDYAKKAFLDNFVEQDGYHVWEIVTRGNGTVAFVQVPLQ